MDDKENWGYLLIQAIQKEGGGVRELGSERFGGRGGSVESDIGGRGVEALWVLQTRACPRHRHLSLCTSSDRRIEILKQL